MLGVAGVVIPIMIVFAFVYTDVVVLIIDLMVFVAVGLLCIPIAFRNYVELQNERLLIVFGFIKRRFHTMISLLFQQPIILCLSLLRLLTELK